MMIFFFLFIVSDFTIVFIITYCDALALMSSSVADWAQSTN